MQSLPLFYPFVTTQIALQGDTIVFVGFYDEPHWNWNVIIRVKVRLSYHKETWKNYSFIESPVMEIAELKLRTRVALLWDNIRIDTVGFNRFKALEIHLDGENQDGMVFESDVIRDEGDVFIITDPANAFSVFQIDAPYLGT